MSRPAVFLDRDGTLNAPPADGRWIASPDEFSWLPGAAEGAGVLARAGYLLAVVSNQRGIANGTVSLGALQAIERVIQRGLAEHRCEIASFAYCPHEVEASCECRKPRPGMIMGLARGLDLDLERSWMIGDSTNDVLAGQAAGCRTVLIGAVPQRCEPDLVAPSLHSASVVIARDAGRGHGRAGLASASNSSISAW